MCPINIGSDKSLAQNRQQAIIWTNDGLIYCAFMRQSAWVNDRVMGLGRVSFHIKMDVIS